MNIYLNIEKLIAYAKIHLLMDEADEIYVRNVIMDKLRLCKFEAYEVDEDEIEDMENPFEIIDPLIDYAVNQGIVKEEDRRVFQAELMDIVSLRPGEMEETIDSLDHAKALEWVFDYALKNGSAFDRFARWENKGDKNIEVIFDENYDDESSRNVENEGKGTLRSDRYIRLPIQGEWYYHAQKRAYVDGLGWILPIKQKPLTLDKEALDTMFDFIEQLPLWYIHTAEGDETAKTTGFICSAKPLPIDRSEQKNKFKSKEYPYITIVETDWYTSTIKLSCTNREKLTELTCKLISAYKDKYDGKIFVGLFKTENKFVVELSFMRGTPKKEHSGLAPLNILSMAGLFVIDREVEDRLKTIEKYLTKEIRFSPLCLTGGMENHAVMIESLLREVSNNKLGAVEAALDVKEESKKTLVSCLNDIKAFDSLAEFLKEFDIEIR